MCLPFRQVNVFSAAPMSGNPVAVVHEADGLTDDQMAAFARWTNLSETTFLLSPTAAGRDGGADYRVRIWTPGGELPFAGHPTLGTAHAWLEAGGEPGGQGVVQECGVGLVRLRRSAVEQGAIDGGTTDRAGIDGRDAPAAGQRLAFAAPPLRRSGPVDDADLARIARALRIEVSDVVRSAWVDNGPGWVAVQLRDAEAVLALEPDYAAMSGLDLGVIGEYGAGSGGAGSGGAGSGGVGSGGVGSNTAAARAAGVSAAAVNAPAANAPGASGAKVSGAGARTGAPAVEVRAFVPSGGVGEDPVTGSLNAGLGQWLAGEVLPSSYIASQGTALGRAGRVYIDKLPDGEVWVGGDTVTTIVGQVEL